MAMEVIQGVHRVAVISDTHNIVREEALQVLSTADLILHAGDITTRQTMERLQEKGRVIAVKGNNDREWGRELPFELSLEICGHRICMIHNRRKLSRAANDAEIVIFGHSHIYEAEEVDGQLWLNPGSGGSRRFGRPVTMALLEFRDDGTFQVQKVVLSQGTAAPRPKFQPGDLDRIVETVIQNLKKGRTKGEVARTYGIPLEMVDQIAQIYYTHPGVDLQGILDRMEIAGR